MLICYVTGRIKKIDMMSECDKITKQKMTMEYGKNYVKPWNRITEAVMNKNKSI